MIKGRRILAWTSVAGLVLMFTPRAYTSEIDILVRKLVEKRILTEEEAREVLAEAQKEIKKKEDVESTRVPEWVRNTKIKGDFRLRYQWEDKTGSPDRSRGRYRFRLGMESKVKERMQISAGFATGGNDARSTNQTMEGGFSTPDVRLDYAYVELKPYTWVTVKAGKIKGIKKLIFRPSDLLWDSDINPEGISILLRKEEENRYGLFMNAGFWVLDESGSDPSDPYMLVIQPGFKYRFNETSYIKLAVAGYIFDNVKGTLLTNGADNSGKYNTLENGVLKYDYTSISPSFEWGVKNFFGGLPYLGIWGDYIYNPDPPSENRGFLLGIKLGDKEVKDFKDWQVKYMYRKLEKDAWLDIFPDSDAYSGHTDTQGHELAFTFGLSRHITLGMDYYYMERIKGKGRKQVLQIDWNVKF